MFHVLDLVGLVDRQLNNDSMHRRVIANCLDSSHFLASIFNIKKLHNSYLKAFLCKQFLFALDIGLTLSAVGNVDNANAGNWKSLAFNLFNIGPNDVGYEVVCVFSAVNFDSCRIFVNDLVATDVAFSLGLSEKRYPKLLVSCFFVLANHLFKPFRFINFVNIYVSNLFKPCLEMRHKKLIVLKDWEVTDLGIWVIYGSWLCEHYVRTLYQQISLAVELPR